MKTLSPPLTRRSFIRGAGVSLALPLLDAMLPRGASAAAAAAPERMVCICTSLGIHPPDFFPTDAGLNYTPSLYLDLIKEHRSDFTIFSGVSHPDQSGADGHSNERTWLTSAKHPGLGGFRNTISVDQLAVEKIGFETRHPFLALGTSNGTQSYTRSGVMIPAESKPSKVFEKLFLEGTPEQVKTQMRKIQEGRSIMDTVKDEANRFAKRVGAADREKLDEYFTSVREMEVRLAKAQDWATKPKPKVDAQPPKDIENQSDLIGRMRLIFQLVPLALQTDSTRVITILVQGRNDVPVVPGVTIDHHNLSHHGQDPVKIEQLRLIEEAEMKAMGDLLTSLKAKKETGAPLLDHTMLLYGSNLGNANSHDTHNLPLLFAGGGFKHQGHVKFDEKNNTPFCNLFVTMLQKMKIETDSFGSSTGTISLGKSWLMSPSVNGNILHMPHSAARLLLRFMGRYRGRVTIGLAMAICGTLLGFVFPGITQWFLDDIIPHKKLDRILPAALMAWGAFALRQVFYSLRTVANNAFELRMTYDLRSQLHDKIQHLPLKWFDRQTTGDILTRMADDVPATQRVILEGVDQAAPAVLQAVLTAGLMLWLHWKLTLVTLLPLPFIAAGGWIYAHWVSPRARTAREAAGGLNSLLHDNISGIRQIKSYTLEEEKQQDFDASSGQYRTHQTKLQRAWAIYGPGMGLLGDTGLILLMGFGAFWAIKGEITIGQLGQFLLLIGMLYEPIGRMHGINQTFVQGAASARRVFDILELDDAEDLKKGIPLGEVRGEIRFENLSFSYDTTRPTLTNVNLLVPAQQTVAIVGATGSGKSTLFQLLTRFYEPDSGDILLDGKSIRELNKASLRDALGYVTQESYLFNQSIRENLKLGKPNATDADLWSALEMACAKDFVERMEGQLNAMVGERGSRLSGGEKQRISIARAILKNAPILLLDEATSAVDTKSEKLIQRAVDTLRTNRTCLVIAHRLSTIKNARQIYVMRQGQILAHGTHEELLKTCEYYAELARLSFSAEKLEVG